MTELPLAGRTAFITGAGRGQGRAHAVRLAAMGAAVIAVDICADMPGFSYSLATPEDLAETCRRVTDAGGRITAQIADVRDLGAQEQALSEGLVALGSNSADIVIANAGAMIFPADVVDPGRAFRDSIDVLLTGAWNTLQVTAGPMVEAARGGSIVLISSAAALAGFWGGDPGGDAYTASKAGLVGLMRVYANILGPHNIRVNTIHPGGVLSGMTTNDAFMAHAMASADKPITGKRNALPTDLLQPRDIAAAVAWLVSDEARYVTGVALPVDAGFVNS